VIAYVFETGWTKFQLGYAAALSMMLFATIVVVTLVELKLVRDSHD
jgi:ABC-type sugar transport system permease subunit